MRLILLFLSIFLAFFASCSSEGNTPDPTPKPPDGTPVDPDSLDRIENRLFIKYNNNGDATITNEHAEVAVEPNGGNVVVRIDGSTETEYNIIVSGTASAGSLKIYGDYKVGLYLNGVNITNPSGPAINIQNGKKISVYLLEKSYLTGQAVYGEAEDAKGAFFSEGQLIFSGGNSLEVIGKVGHAIVTDDYFEMESGIITVKETAGDGIHANDAITIKGGFIAIESAGDAIQSERSSVYVSGGKITAKTTGVKMHGISSEDETVISGNAEVNIEVKGNGSKGIKSTGFVGIEGGIIKIKTTGTTNTNDADETNKVSGIKTNANMKISGGDLTIESTGADAKGISTDGSLEISGGKVTATAHHRAIKTDGDLTISGGTVFVKSLNKKNAIECDGVEDIRITITKEGASDEF
jgi:hypothetical protein